jgi:putative hydrolase of HD superfamily
MMIQDLIDLVKIMFSMRRWNNKPTFDSISEASNSGFVLHVAHLLAMLEIESGNKVDMVKLISRILLKDMPKCIISDISLSTKSMIQSLSPAAWNKLYESSVEEVIKYVPDRFKEKFEDAMINSRDQSIEGRIVNAADLYAAYKEAEINLRFFPEYFKEPFESIENNMKNVEIESFKTFLSSNELRTYLSLIRTLIYAIRWNQHPRTVLTTVSGHTFFVTFVAYLMAEETNNVNVLNAIERAIFHDVPETLTGDIISPTKRRVEGFESAVEEVESKMVHKVLLPLLPNKIAKHYDPLMLKPFEGGIEGKIAKASDLMGSLIECQMEIENGMQTGFFSRGYESLKNQLKAMNLKIVDEMMN